MFPFKNAVLMYFNTELNFKSDDFKAALEAHRHQPISDDEPKAETQGLTPLLMQCDDLLLSTSNHLHLLKVVFESRKVNASMVNKILSKQRTALEKDGTKLDEDQLLTLTGQIKDELLKDTPSTFDVVYVAFDFETGLALFSTTSQGTLKAVRALLFQVAEFQFSLYSPFNAAPRLLNKWVEQGDIGFGLYPGGNVKAKFDTCTLTLKNADLGSDVISDVMKSFDVTELEFIGQRINYEGEATEFINAAINDKGELKQMKWAHPLKHFDDVEPDDTNACIIHDFKSSGLLWRQLMAGLYLSSGLIHFGDEINWPEWLQVAATSFVQAQPTVTDVDHVLLRDAIEFVIESRSASISAIQGQFKIGYNLAARIVEELERQHIVSAVDDEGKRQVLRHKLDAETEGAKEG